MKTEHYKKHPIQYIRLGNGQNSELYRVNILPDTYYIQIVGVKLFSNEYRTISPNERKQVLIALGKGEQCQ